MSSPPGPKQGPGSWPRVSGWSSPMTRTRSARVPDPPREGPPGFNRGAARAHRSVGARDLVLDLGGATAARMSA